MRDLAIVVIACHHTEGILTAHEAMGRLVDILGPVNEDHVREYVTEMGWNEMFDVYMDAAANGEPHLSGGVFIYPKLETIEVAKAWVSARVASP